MAREPANTPKRSAAQSSPTGALYILDEPTRGLHLEDITRLLTVLNQLIEEGNTVLVVEHHLDVIKCADWVINLGPGGGETGGHIVAQGPPEDIANSPNSITGKCLSPLLPHAQVSYRFYYLMLQKTVGHFLLDSYVVVSSPFANPEETSCRARLQKSGGETNYPTTDLTPTLKLTGFRPGSRGPFVPAKGPKTIDTQFGHMRMGRREKRKVGPTRCAQTRPAKDGGVSAHGAEQQASVRKIVNGEIYKVWSCNHTILFRHHTTISPRDNGVSPSKT